MQILRNGKPRSEGKWFTWSYFFGCSNSLVASRMYRPYRIEIVYLHNVHEYDAEHLGRRPVFAGAVLTKLHAATFHSRRQSVASHDRVALEPGRKKRTLKWNAWRLVTFWKRNGSRSQMLTVFFFTYGHGDRRWSTLWDHWHCYGSCKEKWTR